MRKKIILVDSDVISHFMAANKIDDLTRILDPHIVMIVDQVYRESSHHPFLEERKDELDSWMRRCHVQVISIPDNNWKTKVEYARLKKENPRLGAGERECMAIARYGGEVIASSNFRDVANYCDLYGIEYIGFMDILCIAVKKKNIFRGSM
ncbi:hypothetical protein [Prevotella sp. AGR2160]|uniref:hypothetical protein n=1 Tax=Prevotella sp. AGR2160 TaxID=1280674 RepID=UPI00048B08A8|nr:hypothetical protein [Prevotella sp. AGR2160]